jgi:hypothetical protein
MRVSKKAVVDSMPSLAFGLGVPAWSASSGRTVPINVQVMPINHGGSSLLAEGVRKMKVLGNAAALLAALSVMAGLILAQRNYQNSWRETSAVQMSATAVTPGHAGEYKVVMK